MTILCTVGLGFCFLGYFLFWFGATLTELGIKRGLLVLVPRGPSLWYSREHVVVVRGINPGSSIQSMVQLFVVSHLAQK